MTIADIIGNIIYIGALVCNVSSTFCKTKKNTMLLQCFNVAFGITANIFIFSLSAVVVSISGLIRNILSYKDRLDRKLTYTILFPTVIFSLVMNTKGYIGLLPVASTMLFSMLLYKVKTAQGIKLMNAACNSIWCTHDFLVMNYTAAVTDIVIVVISLVNWLRLRKGNREECRTEQKTKM